MSLFSRFMSVAAVALTALSVNVSVSTAASAQTALPQCPTGFSLNAGRCTRPAVAPQFSCPSGYTLSGQTCTIKLSSATPARCPGSMGLPGNSSTCQTYDMRTRKWGAPTAQATCSTPGARLQGAQCVVERTQTIPASPGGRVSCSPGSQVGSQCVTNPTCPSNAPFLRGNICRANR